MTTVHDLEERVREEVREQWQDLLDDNGGDLDPESNWVHNTMTDRFFEIADSSVPVYNGDLLEIAAEHMDFALLTPEVGPAFDGEPTPINIIAANIYEWAHGIAYDEWRAIVDEYEPPEDEDEDDLLADAILDPNMSDDGRTAGDA